MSKVFAKWTTMFESLRRSSGDLRECLKGLGWLRDLFK